MSHIAVERNRRRQMNDHLKVLRSLTPAVYIKRGDQASIIGGAIDFIKELQQLLESLEARKKRRSSSSLCSTGGNGSGSASNSYSCSYSSSTLSPTTPSPRSHLGLGLAGVSSCSPAAAPVLQQQQRRQHTTTELAACCNSPVADVEAKISGSNVLLRTLSRRIPGHQAVTIIAMLEALHLEVLHLNISTMEDTVLYSFVLKIGLECQLSVDDLAYEVQQTFVVSSPRQREQEQEKLEQQHNNLMYSAMAI